MAKGFKTGGRAKGTPNKITATVRETFERVFNALQEGGTADLESWAKENPTEFYKLVSKLIPAELSIDAAVIDATDLDDDDRMAKLADLLSKVSSRALADDSELV